MKLNKNVAVSDTGYIFNPNNGDSFSCNAVGADIVAMLKDGVDQADIINYLTDKYEVNARTAERDLDDFVMQLRDSALLSND